MTNLICPLLSFMFNFIHSSSTFLVQETASKKKTGRINLIKYVANFNYQAYSNSTLLHETTYLKD